MLEEELKSLIKKKYGSVRQFALKIDIPYTTVDTILKRGIDNSNVGNVLKMCKALNISIDNLVDNKEIIQSFDIDNAKIDDLINKNTISYEELEKRLKQFEENEGIQVLIDNVTDMSEKGLNQVLNYAKFLKEQDEKEEQEKT